MIDIPGTVADGKSRSLERPLVIYGAGNTGRAVARLLESGGRTVVAFVGEKAVHAQSCLSKPLWSLPRCVKAIQVSAMDVLVAAHNRDDDMPPLIQHVSTAGFSEVCR